MTTSPAANSRNSASRASLRRWAFLHCEKSGSSASTAAQSRALGFSQGRSRSEAPAVRSDACIARTLLLLHWAVRMEQRTLASRIGAGLSTGASAWDAATEAAREARRNGLEPGEVDLA